MPGDDHGHGEDGWDTDDGSGAGPLGTDQGSATHWNTLESPLSAEAVKERIRRALAHEPPFAGVSLSGAEGRRGFLLKFKAGGRVLLGEITLAAWDGGTQVHVAAPAEVQQKDVQVLVDSLRRVLR